MASNKTLYPAGGRLQRRIGDEIIEYGLFGRSVRQQADLQANSLHQLLGEEFSQRWYCLHHHFALRQAGNVDRHWEGQFGGAHSEIDGVSSFVAVHVPWCPVIEDGITQFDVRATIRQGLRAGQTGNDSVVVQSQCQVSRVRQQIDVLAEARQRGHIELNGVTCAAEEGSANANRTIETGDGN